MKNAANTSFNKTLLTYPEQTLAAVSNLNPQLEELNCCFGDTAIPCFLKPYFLSHKDTAYLRKVITHLFSMLEKITHAYESRPDIRHYFNIPKKMEEWITYDPGYRRNIVISRPDAFLTDQGYRFIEFNCDSPAGSGYADIEEKILRRSFAMRTLGSRFRWHSNIRLGKLLDALLTCYREYGGARKHPQIAIVDWKTMRTQNEFKLTRDYFKSRGYDSIVADPCDLKYRNGRLEVKGFRIDLIYRRVIIGELWERRREVQDFLKAYRLGKVCVVNPLRSRLASNKAIISILTNPDFDDMFTPEERRTRDRHIPWTRRVVDARKFYRGREIRLKHWMLEHQKKLVLKPAGRYGGYGVLIGRETKPSLWKRKVRAALTDQEAWVIQELVKIPQMKVPLLERGKVKLVSKKLNINPFIFNGRYGGAMVRLSDESVINVSAGGGLIPVITYSRR